MAPRLLYSLPLLELGKDAVVGANLFTEQKIASVLVFFWDETLRVFFSFHGVKSYVDTGRKVMWLQSEKLAG